MATPSKPLALLASAEQHIAAAQEALDALKAMQLPHLAERLTSVIEKHTEVETALRAKKLEVLRMLLELRFLMNDEVAFRPASLDEVVYTVDRPVVVPAPLIKIRRNGSVAHLPLSACIAHSDFRYFAFCDHLLFQLERFIHHRPQEQQQEIVELRRLIDQMKKL